MRTWIHVEPSDRSPKLGYLRAGAVVERGDASAGDTGCPGGWYRIQPRGYVCVGSGASLSLDHPVVQAAARGPNRQALPYAYVFSKSPPPQLYFKLPSRSEQEQAEGRSLQQHLSTSRSRRYVSEGDPVPEFLLQGNALPKPYGSDETLHLGAHAGRAKAQSAFGLVTSFDWTGRRFGLTTELDLIALDRTHEATVSAFRGITIQGKGTPAFVIRRGAQALRLNAEARLVPAEWVPFRSGWLLTGNALGGLLETSEGLWLPASSLVVAELREDPMGYAREGRRWIDVSIKRQLLVAYEGRQPAFATLVSTGRAELGDPSKTTATIRGLFKIRQKNVSSTMDGAAGSDAFDLRDVPWVQYFHEGYALHAAYWHDDFGKPRSHGCVNLSPEDARWLFDWTDPAVPADWHGAVTTEAGTLVWTHA